MGVADAIKSARDSISLKRPVGAGRYAENSSALGRMGFHATTYHHLEQYRRYRGYTYSIVRTIANRCAGQMIKVGRKQKNVGGEKSSIKKQRLPLHLKGREHDIRLYRNHPIIQCLSNPNPIMVGSVLMYVTVASIQVTGKAHWWMTRDEETGAPQIWALPSHWCEPIHTSEKLFHSWRIQPDGSSPFIVRNSDMVYFYLPDISDPLSAYGPADALSRTIQVDEQTEETQRRSLMNSINPALAITVGAAPGESPISSMAAAPVLSKAQRKTIKAILRQEYQGAINADEPIILDAFIKDVKQLRATPREVDFPNSSNAVKKRLSQGWGVNPISMGEIESASRNSSSVADGHLCDNVINPLLTMMSQTMTCQMPAFFTGRDDEIVYIEEAAAKDIDFDLSMEEAMVDRGAMTINEWRERHGLPPLAEPITPPARVSVYLDGRQGDSTDVDGDGNPDSMDVDPPEKMRGQIPSNTFAKTLGVTGTVNLWVKKNDDYRKKLATTITATLRTLGHAAMEKFNSHNTSTPRDAKLCVDINEWARKLKNACIPILQAEAEHAAVTEWVLYRNKKSTESLPGRISGVVKKYIQKITKAKFWKKIATAVAVAVGRSVAAAIENKTSLTAAAESVLISSTTITKRAKSLADEEIESAVNAGKNATYAHLVSIGRVRGRRWHNPMDGRERKSHHDAHGQIAYGGSPFVVGGYDCQYPKDSSLPAAERCNCRCTTVNVM